MRQFSRAMLATLVTASCAVAQSTDDPFSGDIVADEGIVEVAVREFATLPGAGAAAVRMMLLIDEPGTGRMFVNGMRGPIFGVNYDGRVERYVDIDDDAWGVSVASNGRERGFQSFAFHPDFGRTGAPGYGRFYTWTDTDRNDVAADFTPGGGSNAHHTVLLEWRAADATAATYDGGPPRELLRLEQPYGNHNAGHLAFHPLASSGDPEYGLLYVGVADGGSGGDPLGLAQNMASPFGKVLRIDPLGSSSANGAYGIPADNPFVGRSGALGEIWALGVRNPQRFGWDPATGAMYLADIGQNTIEELSPVSAGANLGWNVWEGSFRYAGRGGVDASDPGSNPSMTYPVAEWAHGDPAIGSRSAATGVVVVRSSRVPRLRDRVLFGDFPSGEIFHFDADDPPAGGNQGFRRLLLVDDGEAKTLLQLVREKNAEQGREPASRVDLRFGEGPDGRVFLLNKHDDTIREIVPGG